MLTHYDIHYFPTPKTLNNSNTPRNVVASLDTACYCSGEYPIWVLDAWGHSMPNTVALVCFLRHPASGVLQDTSSLAIEQPLEKRFESNFEWRTEFFSSSKRTLARCTGDPTS